MFQTATAHKPALGKRPQRGQAGPGVPIRMAIISLDSHRASTLEGARVHLQAELPGLSLHLHAATEFAAEPARLKACLDDIAHADIIFANMLFMEEHCALVQAALEARRAACDALVVCLSASEITKLTRMGRFDMRQPSGPLLSLLRKLRGGASSQSSPSRTATASGQSAASPSASPSSPSSPSASPAALAAAQSGNSAAQAGNSAFSARAATAQAPHSAGEKQMAMLRRLPKILRFIPGTAQDVRAYFLSMQYWLSGSEQNLVNLVRFLIDRYASGPREVLRGRLRVDDPVEYPDVGIYHPRIPGLVSASAIDLPPVPGAGPRPRVGVLVLRSYVLAGNVAHYDAVIAALEARGLEPVCAFASGLDARGAIERFFLDAKGAPTIDALVSLTGFSLVGGPAYNDAKAAEAILGRLDVPYLAAQPVEFQTLEQWENSARGLLPVEATMMVAIPELDGATGSIIFGGRSERARGGEQRDMRAHAERVDTLAARVERLVRLRSTPKARRRLAIVIFGFPPHAGAIGTAAHLDVFASLWNLLGQLAAEGWQLERPESPEALRACVLEGNAARFGTHANVVHAIPVDAHVARETWLEEISAQWGPAPGRAQSDGRSIFVLGAQLGEVLIAVQPAFGYEGDPMRLLFERSFAPTHAFAAFYRYLREDFGAHALLHFGTHGALEFMPGKQCGLSAQCWPDRLLGNLPNFYLYAANNPSEGTIAKRRAAATLLSYLTPPLAQAGLYAGLLDLKALIDRWRCLAPDQYAQREPLAQMILEQARALSLPEACAPVGMPPAKELHKAAAKLQAPCVPASHDRLGAPPADMEAFVSDLASRIHDIECSLIPEGMHVLGAPLAREALALMLRAMARASMASGEAGADAGPLGQAIDQTAQLIEAQLIEAQSTGVQSTGAQSTGAQSTGAKLTGAPRPCGLSAEALAEALSPRVRRIAARNGLCADELLGVLRAGCFLAIDQETPAILAALDGRFVRPSPGGDLLRSPEILPTGRNIHGFDPYRIPSRFALADGVRQANLLIERHRAEGHGFPTSIALVLWGSDNLKTEGAPLAQALALIGARPRFDGYGRLSGAELIPLGELGRPRIDLVMSLSGIFRDLLPLQTRMLAEAAYLAAQADEPLSMNFVRRNALAHMQAQGCDFDTACLRVFSNADGAYGANVSHLIDNARWQEEDELAETFSRRKSFAYDRKGVASEQAPLLRAALAGVALAYQNLDAAETGVTSLDQYFDSLGGISRAAQRAGGQPIPVYISDQTHGPPRVRTLEEQVDLETRTRMLNPRWYEGMLKHGYEGVRQIEAHLTNTLGWSATTGKVAPWVYQQVTETFIKDPRMRERLAVLNPTASAKLVHRLLEAHERSYWQPDDDTLRALRQASDDIEDRIEGVWEGATV